MTSSNYNSLYFIPSKFSQPTEKEGISRKQSCTSWQKHASHEYHRRVKLHQSPIQKHLNSKPKRSFEILTWSTQSSPSKTEDDSEVSGNIVPSPDPGAISIRQWDPFASAVPNDAPQYTREMLFHAISQQWQVFASTKTASETNEISRSVLSYSMKSKATFYTVVFAAATHWSYAHIGSEVPEKNRSFRLHYKGLALEELRKEVASLKTYASEQLLMCIITLAAHGTGETLNPPSVEENKMTSPLCKVQDFDYYTAMQWETAHLQAVRQLINVRGGLTTIQTPGLANAIALADIFTATRELRQPFFSLVVSTDIVMSLWPEIDNRNTQLSHLASGFQILANTIALGPLLKAIESLHQLTLGFDMYLNETALAPTLFQIVSARNTVQHDLLSIEAKLDASDLSSSISVVAYSSQYGFERCITCETATIIPQLMQDLVLYAALAYSLLVFFPLPRSAGCHARISTRLQQILERCDIVTLPQSYNSLLLWATMLGGAVADDQSQRSFFVERIVRTQVMAISDPSQSVELRDGRRVCWETIKDVCFTFLWYDKFDLEREVESLWLQVNQKLRGVAVSDSR